MFLISNPSDSLFIKITQANMRSLPDFSWFHCYYFHTRVVVVLVVVFSSSFFEFRYCCSYYCCCCCLGWGEARFGRRNWGNWRRWGSMADRGQSLSYRSKEGACALRLKLSTLQREGEGERKKNMKMSKIHDKERE